MLQFPPGATGRPPRHVLTPSQFEYWFHQQWENHTLMWDTTVAIDDILGPDGEVVGLELPRLQLVIPWAGVSVTASALLDSTFAPVQYSYDFRDRSDTIIARYDYHEGHPEIGLAHVHFSDNEDCPAPSATVTFFEAFDAVVTYRAQQGITP